MPFGSWYEQAGQRGIGILVGEREKGCLDFYLQFRAVDLGKDSEVRADGDVPVSLACSVPIQFCPWCGKDLARWYRATGKSLIRSSPPLPFSFE